jgi:hypothetical protein
MPKRNVFYDESGKEICAYVKNDDSLFIEIKDEDAQLSIELSSVDAALFILDLYRMGRKNKF